MKKSVSKKKKVRIDKKRFTIVIGGALLLLLVVVGGVLLTQKKHHSAGDYYSIEGRSGKISETVVGGAKANGWLRVQGTDIDTPIIVNSERADGAVSDDYLWTSTNYVEGENRKVIYGHNIRNVSSYPDIVNPEHIRFEQLVSFARYDFAKNNLYIQYNDGTGDELYKIYAVTFNNESSEYGQSYKQDELQGYIDTVRKESVYDYDVDVNSQDKLISLVTCTRYFGAQEKTQFKVDARKLRENEKIVQYTVETNINYDIIK